MLTRHEPYCRACIREGLPGPEHIGEVPKEVVVTATRNALEYWRSQVDSPHVLQAGREYARGQVTFFEKQYQELTGHKP